MKNITNWDWRKFKVTLRNMDGSTRQSVMTGSRLDQWLAWSPDRVADWEELPA